MRKVIYISGTRADYGLFSSTLKRIDEDASLDLSICVTGMHLQEEYGYTVQEIEADKIRICARIKVALSGKSGGEMSRAIGREVIGITEALEKEQPDIVIVLGDRGEMLAGALAAIHLNIPIAHIHGGERTGTVDEPIRHAISKLSHYHFVATEGARARLVRMGEQDDRVFITGAPGLDGIRQSINYDRNELCKQSVFDPDRKIAIVVFHPVVQDSNLADTQIQAIMDNALLNKLQIIALLPNADSGGANAEKKLGEYADHPDVRIHSHIGRDNFVSWLAAADLMIGNSSSGIIETATLGIPVVNVGDRQQGRERNENVIDVPFSDSLINDAITNGLSLGRKEWNNVYGDGAAGKQIVQLIKSLSLDKALLKKSNAY